MSKQPTPKADQLRAMREAKFTVAKGRKPMTVTTAAAIQAMAEAAARALVSTEKAKTKRAARKRP